MGTHEMINIKTFKLVVVTLLLTTTELIQASSLYTLDYSDSHGNTWALNFDGTNKGVYVDNLSNVSLYFNSVSAGALTVTAFDIYGPANNVRVGFDQIYSNFDVESTNPLDTYTILKSDRSTQQATGGVHVTFGSYGPIREASLSDTTWATVATRIDTNTRIDDWQGGRNQDGTLYRDSSSVATYELITNASVPEPTSIALLIAGLLGFASQRKKATQA